MQNHQETQKRTSSKGLLTTARIIGGLWVFFCLFGLIGYGMEGYQRTGILMPTDWLGFATVVCLLAGLAGLVVAFWRPGPGGFISLTGFTLSAIFMTIDPLLNFSIIFLILYIPSAMYLSYWWNRKKGR
ncbi:MAG: hypothetical protein WCO63_14790 [Bacteroidota bacterium]